MSFKKGQLLTISLIDEIKDCFGVLEISILINDKLYTYPISSEFALRKFKSLLRRKKLGKALQILGLFKIEGFNSFEQLKKDKTYA